jgi:hypothetical protein
MENHITDDTLKQVFYTFNCEKDNFITVQNLENGFKAYGWG